MAQSYSHKQNSCHERASDPKGDPAWQLRLTAVGVWFVPCGLAIE